MRILKAAGAIVGMLVLCGAGCGSAPTAMVADRPVIANQPPPPSGTSLEFNRVVVFVPQGTKVGVESCGGIGIGSPISWKVGDKTLEIGAYRAAFNQELGTAGYNVDRQRSVFENLEEKSHADLLVGASIPEMSLNRCNPVLYAAALGTMALLMKKSADATIAVDWEILDTLEHKVIFRTRTSGQGTAAQGSVSIDVAIQTAFQQAARNLARDPAFRDAVAKFKHPQDMASGSNLTLRFA